jgi:hypothetical protein
MILIYLALFDDIDPGPKCHQPWLPQKGMKVFRFILKMWMYIHGKSLKASAALPMLPGSGVSPQLKTKALPLREGLGWVGPKA